MKKLYTFLAAVFIVAGVFAQTPEKMSYQAVIRNSNNQLVTNQHVGMQISILQGSANGTAVYVETQNPNANANGLVSIEIGNGSVVSGNFAAIDWANGPYFIQTETDPTGGTDYTITGTSQLLSVPYALHAKTAETVMGGIAETDPVYTNSQAANITATDITNLSNLSGTNTGDQDLTPLATKIALADSTAKVRSEIPDVSGFISTEADPEFTNSEAANITAADITNLRNQSGTNTGDQDLSPLATKTALADSIAQVRSEIPDISGLITTETDPAFKGSEAANITTADMTNLRNQSGTNTGDQDISGIAVNKLAIQDTAAQIRADIPDVSDFISTEADPVFSAWDKDYTDLSNKPTIPSVYNSAVTFTGTAVGSSPQTVRLNQSGNKTITINQADVSGFITTETDPKFTTWDKSTGISITESQISDLDHFTTDDETDPNFGASVASGITGTDTTYWNNKQDQLVAGTNISIVGNTISATSGSTLAIGQSYQGGIIFWLDDTGQHGLIAAREDLSTKIPWYNGTYKYTGTTGDGLYSGAMNTTILVATQMADNQTGNFAAKGCADYSVTESGVTYGDWYLPSKYELNLLYLQQNAVGGFASVWYWSSTENNNLEAWVQYFANGSQFDEGKGYTKYVRPIRAF